MSSRQNINNYMEFSNLYLLVPTQYAFLSHSSLFLFSYLIDKFYFTRGIVCLFVCMFQEFIG
jgi:hypothetical protein